MSPSPRPRPAFVYDGDCGFCEKWARWLADRTDPDIDFIPMTDGAGGDVAGVTPEDIKTASVFVDEAGTRHSGADGFAQVLRRSDGAWAILGTVGTLPVARELARASYGLVARNRHRLPGPPDH